MVIARTDRLRLFAVRDFSWLSLNNLVEFFQTAAFAGHAIWPPRWYARLAMWPARAADTPVSTCAVGSLRGLIQSKKFCMWEIVPSRKLSDRTAGFWLSDT